MTSCENCGTTILFGPVREGERQYCSHKCRDAGHNWAEVAELPEEFVLQKAKEFRDRDCPNCGGEGPVEIHLAHKISSFLVLTSYKSVPTLGCNRCGSKHRWRAIAHCSLFGWWGFPWGVFGTPVQIIRNFGGTKHQLDEPPSPELVQVVRADLASQLASAHASAEAE